jgi:anti-anti-sigma factor
MPGRTDTVVLTHRGTDGEPVVVLSGRLGISSVARLRDAVMNARTDAKALLRVDLSRVSAIDAVGVRTLVACRRLTATLGVDLLLVHPSHAAAKRLARTGLAKVFRVEHGTDQPAPTYADRPMWNRHPSLAAGAATHRH